MRNIVKRLRQELGDDASNPAYIFNEPRVGYRTAEAETKGREEQCERGDRSCVPLSCSNIMIGPRGSVGLQSPQPHLEYGSAYGQNRPT